MPSSSTARAASMPASRSISPRNSAAISPCRCSRPAANRWRRGRGLDRRGASALLREPDVVQPPAVVHAVDHRRQALDPWMPAGRAAGVEDDWPGALLLQPAVDLPDQLLALLRVGLGGLAAERGLELAIAVAGEVAVGVAGVAFVELLVGVVDHRGAGVLHPDHVVPPGDLRVPVGGLDDVELAGNVD